MNSYELKQQRRRERYEALAKKAAEESGSLTSAAMQMIERIPPGQPILIGHHSENRDRNYRERASRKMGKAVEMKNKAEHYAYKAAVVGHGGISSDDPEALDKLRRQLRDLQEKQNHNESSEQGDTKRRYGSATGYGFERGRHCRAYRPFGFWRDGVRVFPTAQ